jgi:very-short-patch-repair endonuclease
VVRVRPGVYATSEFTTRAKKDPRLGEASRVMAAVLGLPSGNAVASHWSAAVVHGLDLLNAPRSDTVTVTRPPGRYHGRARGVRFYSAELPPGQVAERFGTRVTTPARTVVDLARTLSFIEGVVVADSALHLGKAAKAGLEEVLAACSGWPGISRARKVVEFSDRRSESVLESCARVIFDEHGLEPPELQVTLETSEGLFRVDFYWREHRTIAEADGRTKYETPNKARNQLIRDQLLRDTGRSVVHFTWQELFYESDRLIRRVTNAFSSA